MKEEDILRTAERLGFSHAGFMAAADLCFMKEVRDMCAADRCHMYGRSWMCPPACGTLEENAARASSFRRVLLVQTTARLEDAFDIDTMTRAEAEHKDRFIRLCDALRRETRCLPPGQRRLHPVPSLRLSRRPLPHAPEGGSLHGKLRTSGLRDLSGRRHEVLLRTGNPHLYQLRPAG